MNKLWFVCVLLVCVGCASSNVTEEGGEAVEASKEAPAQGLPSGPAGLVSGEVAVLGAGQSVTKASGCMAQAAQEEPATRSSSPAEGESVRATVYGAGVHVTHELPHNCCMRAVTTVAVDEASRAVRVVHRLEGQVCRCVCGSTLKTSVGLAPGVYTLEVSVEQPEQAPRVAYAGEVRVGD